MSAQIQYDLFEAIPDETECLKIEVGQLKESLDKMRKGLFARQGELSKMCFDMHERMEIIERNICKR